MHKYLLVMVLGLLLVDNADAQKLVRFSNVNKDTVKVDPVQGFSFSIESNPTGLLGYFHEMRIGKLSTFTLSGEGMVSKSIRKITPIYNDDGYNIGADLDYGPGFYLRASAEYRLYFSLINRTMKGKTTLHNSGFYFSLPVTVMSGIINPSPHLGSSWNFGNFLPYLKPAIGYRYAFSNRFLMEADVGLATYLNFDYGIQYNPVVSLKGAYTFGSSKR